MKNSYFKDFYNLTKIQKTIRFRLIPFFETKNHIKKQNLFEEDQIRAECYPVLKDIANDFYRDFIDDNLSDLEFDWSALGDAHLVDEEDKLESVQDAYRKQIADLFRGKVDKSGEKTKAKPEIPLPSILKGDLIKKYLPAYVETKYKGDKKTEAIKALEMYKRFTSRLTNFFDSRKNIFTDEDKSTAISFRIIHDNFPLFLRNIAVFQENNLYIKEQILELETHLIQDSILKSDEKIIDYFTLPFFNHVCVQSGIDKYNTIIGGYTKENNTKIQGINEIINLKQQSINKGSKSVDRDEKIKLGRLTQLKKQILSLSDTSSFLIEAIEDDTDLFDRLKKFFSVLQGNNEDQKNYFKEIQILPDTLEEADSNKIYINAKYINRISNSITKSRTTRGDYTAINRGLEIIDSNKDSNVQTYLKAIEEEQNFADREKQIYISLAELEAAIEAVGRHDDKDYTAISIKDYLSNIDYRNFEKEMTSQYQTISKLIDENQNLLGNYEAIDIIKEFLDKIMYVYTRWRIFECDNQLDKDNLFYPGYDHLLEVLENIIRLYNLTRNYLSQKPSQKRKIKINFNNPTLADGWSESKIKSNNTIILRKDNLFYLAIMTQSKVYDELIESEHEFRENLRDDYYERLNYFFMPDAAKMIPKSSIALREVREYFNENPNSDEYIVDNNNFSEPLRISRELYEMQYVDLYDGKKKYQVDYLRKTGDEEGYREALAKWIDFCKKFVNSYSGRRHFDYSDLKSADLYENLNDFYTDVDSRSFQMKFTKISEKTIREMVKDGRLLLFQIYNKDFSEKSTGKPNLFTIYWKALFSEENLRLNKIKLDGQAEIFFRPKQIKKPIKHEKGSFVVNRFDVNGNLIPEKILQEIKDYKNGRISADELNEETKDGLNSNIYKYFKADYEIIKDRRYTEDRMFFHVPISFNWDLKSDARINDLANRYISTRDDIHIIGIDRGENHLLYYVVMNLKGEIVEQGSLNDLVSHTKDNKAERKIPYQKMLSNREKERAEARVSWHAIEKIKDLKEGYLSHVVHFLTKLMMKYNAIVVLEDLNFGFKRGRFKVERQVYQKFELALMNKLNCLISKDRRIDELGGALYPIQLCRRIDVFKNLGKQNGIVFYVPAAYTSVVDPITGFANLFKISNLRINDRIRFFEKFNAITYHKDQDLFSFEFDYKKLPDFVRINNLAHTNWQVYTNDVRYSWSQSDKEMKKVDLTEELKQILEKYGIDYTENPNILEAFVNMENSPVKKNLASELLKIFRLTVKVRNNDQGANPDYIISPVKDLEGNFFDSRENTDYLPENADANGAYNIARKGLLYREQLIDSIKENKRVSLGISNKDWFDFITR